jgi:hypothetical protein
MKKIKITPYKALSLIFIILSTGSHSLAAPSLIGCTVQFSKDSTAIELSVNYGGSQITTTLHKTTTPKITFEIPKSITQTHYIKIDPQSSYKYYILDLINDAWEIKEDTLPETGQIPDRAIIIECYPEWISDFKGGSAVELPTLYLNNAANDKKESNEKLEEDLIKLELTALDSKLFYAPIRRQIQTASDKKRVLIMDLIT